MDANSDGHVKSSAKDSARSNLYIRGLPRTTTNKDLFNMCAKFGDIVSTKSVHDKAISSSKGYGFVLFSSPKSAEMAVAELTKTGVQAQIARVPANEQQGKHHSQQNSKLNKNRSRTNRHVNAKGPTIVFDQDERIHFVKGFAKRKQERRDRAKQEMLHKENEIRKLLRQKRKEALKRE